MIEFAGGCRLNRVTGLFEQDESQLSDCVLTRSG